MGDWQNRGAGREKGNKWELKRVGFGREMQNGNFFSYQVLKNRNPKCYLTCV